MQSTEEKLARSLTAESVELIPYLPYLLQDLWELGSSPKDMVHLLAKHGIGSKNLKVLDLACGKGAVSITVAKVFGCEVKGVDLLPKFILEARKKAEEHDVEGLCTFVVGDIQESVTTEKEFDLVILGAVGDVLGDPEETLRALSSAIRRGGYVLLDDGYGEVASEDSYTTKAQWMEVIRSAGFQVLDEMVVDESEFSEVAKEQMTCISKRVEELIAQFPQHAQLFDGYMKSQLAEVEELETKIVGVTLLLQKKKDPEDSIHIKKS